MAAAESGMERARILKERARTLARPLNQTPVATPLELLGFELAHERYGVETRYVREVHSLKDLTPVPCTPRFVLGIINVRGEMCTVIDLKRLIGLPERGLTNAAGAVILQDQGREFGVVADIVNGVIEIPESEILPPPEALQAGTGEFLFGVTGDGLIVLRADRVIAHPALIVNEQVGYAAGTVAGRPDKRN